MPRKRQNFGQARSDIKNLERQVLDLNKKLKNAEQRNELQAKEIGFLREQRDNYKRSYFELSDKVPRYKNWIKRMAEFVRGFDPSATEEQLKTEGFIMGVGTARVFSRILRILPFAQCPNAPCGCHREGAVDGVLMGLYGADMVSRRGTSRTKEDGTLGVNPDPHQENCCSDKKPVES